MKEFTKTFKSGPFKFPKLTENHPLYGRLLAKEISQLKLLPDFSEDKGLFILSDFGGEHNGANFSTYSFLICSADKRAVFEQEVIAIRKKHKLDSPWKELGYKDLRYGPIKRALDEILDAADKLTHGLLLTVSIDKNIESLFGLNRKEAHSNIVSQLQENDLGKWKGNEAEKLLRVCHAIALILSVLGENGQKLLWICDHDSINEEGNERDFSHTQSVLGRTLAMYSDNQYEILGFAKPFNGDAGTSDLLSLTDFSAGAIQEVLQSELTKKDVKVSDEKGKIIKWMGTESKFLKKVNLVFVKQDDGDWGVGPVELTA
jgi:hypothetical protein